MLLFHTLEKLLLSHRLVKGVHDVTESGEINVVFKQSGEMAVTNAQAGDGEVTVVSHWLVKWWLGLNGL